MKTPGQLKARVKETALRKATGHRHVVHNNRETPLEERVPRTVQCKTCCDQPWRRELICEECGLPYEAERLRKA